MREIAKTRMVLSAYVKGGMKSVAKYLSNSELEFQEGTWVFKAKNLLENKCPLSLEQEINLMLYKFILDDKIKEEPRGEDS
jgi:hypothetical protein